MLPGPQRVCVQHWIHIKAAAELKGSKRRVIPQRCAKKPVSVVLERAWKMKADHYKHQGSESWLKRIPASRRRVYVRDKFDCFKLNCREICSIGARLKRLVKMDFFFLLCVFFFTLPDQGGGADKICEKRDGWKEREGDERGKRRDERGKSGFKSSALTRANYSEPPNNRARRGRGLSWDQHHVEINEDPRQHRAQRFSSLEAGDILLIVFWWNKCLLLYFPIITQALIKTGSFLYVLAIREHLFAESPVYIGFYLNKRTLIYDGFCRNVVEPVLRPLT